MSGPLILFVGAIYLCIALDRSYNGDLWMGLVFFGYALANVGFFYLAR